MRELTWAAAEHCKILINDEEQKAFLRGTYYNLGPLVG
jgi:hypothetical protein